MAGRYGFMDAVGVVTRFFAGPLLALETSCDETAAAVLVGSQIRANIVASQVELHRKWGGVVPEAAARAHVEAIVPVIDSALSESGVTLDQVEAIAVTNRPGLVGALSVGVSAAKALAFRGKIPFIGVHHIEGHICSALAVDPTLAPPFLALIVSGGHTELIAVRAWGSYAVLGQGLDDAAGEAFDKGARALGLGYPGGVAVQREAARGNPKRYLLPQALSHQPYNFSFSGVKTAVARLIEREGGNLNVADAAASLQFAIVEVLAAKALAAAEAQALDTVIVAGGVSANLALRERVAELAERQGVRLIVPPIELCTDNAAMIGLAGSLRLAAAERSDYDLDVMSMASL
ncbi:MAG: tRNA (adenosine(37)-N6)-threonylcarbamoyltransferase complex transferase subunit TsaD [Fimbriimonadaceae bacterium]